MRLKGYTLAEVLVTITIIGIIAGITTTYINQRQEEARLAKVQSELDSIVRSIQLAQIATQAHLISITGTNNTMESCAEAVDQGQDLRDPDNHSECLNHWKNALTKLSAAAGMDLNDFVYDSWGSPYLLDEGGAEDCGFNLIASAGKNGDFSDKTLVVNVFAFEELACNQSTPTDNSGDEIDSLLDGLFPNFPPPKFPDLKTCFNTIESCNDTLMDCSVNKNRNGCAVKTVNFFDKLGLL